MLCVVGESKAGGDKVTPLFGMTFSQAMNTKFYVCQEAYTAIQVALQTALNI